MTLLYEINLYRLTDVPACQKWTFQVKAVKSYTIIDRQTDTKPNVLAQLRSRVVVTYDSYTEAVVPLTGCDTWSAYAATRELSWWNGQQQQQQQQFRHRGEIYRRCLQHLAACQAAVHYACSIPRQST